MPEMTMSATEPVSARARELFRTCQERVYRQIDRAFAVLLVLQWIAALTAALWLTPYTWAGPDRSVHPHVWAALLLGGATALGPLAPVLTMPGRTFTRHTVAAAQMLQGALLIHLTGGRIETHFHVFGSLAFLAFYRDWRVLITASAVVAGDHILRGAFWPQSVYGIAVSEPWRWLEHASWVVFEDVFLVLGCLSSIRWMRGFAGQQAKLEAVNASIEAQVKERTAELEVSREEFRAARDMAEAASRAKGEFLANMSHEIRTPMNGILGMTQLALETSLSAEQREYLGLVRTSGEALLTVLNDILDFSKIEAGKLDLAPTEFTLRDMAADAVRTLALRAHEKGLELAFDVGSDVPDRLFGDPDRLRQVLLNLVGNAVKFTENGEVVVRVHVEQAACRPTHQCAVATGDTATMHYTLLHFEVHDTGIGIAAAKQAAIFEAFTQADGSTTRKYGGTGLGLTISARLVALMGGRIWVESESGRGSTFHFTAQLGVQPAAAADPGPPVPLAGIPVLVVDDNTTNRIILAETAHGWGMRPMAVAGAADALRALQRAAAAGQPFALVLTDAMMPDIDGFTLVERVRGHESLAGTAIVLLSSAGRSGDVSRCRVLGVPYMTKPAKPSDLLRAIRQALRQSGHTSSPTIAPPITAVNRAGLRVLLAEDNIVNQRLVVRLLEKQGYSVTVAGDGQAALDALAQASFDMVLMDVQMPRLNGLEATTRLRESERTTGERTPVIALTAHAMRGDIDRCLAAGMDGYVSKPVQVDELLRTIAAAVPAAKLATC